MRAHCSRASEMNVSAHMRVARSVACSFFLLCVCLGASLHVCAYLHVFVCLCVPVALSASMFAVRVTRLSQTVLVRISSVGVQWRLPSIPAIIFCLRCACGCLCVSACVCVLCVFARASVGVFRVLHTHICVAVEYIKTAQWAIWAIFASRARRAHVVHI